MFSIFSKHTWPSNSSLVIEIDALTVSLLSKLSSLKDTKMDNVSLKQRIGINCYLSAVSDTYLISRLFWPVLDVGRNKQLNLVPQFMSGREALCTSDGQHSMGWFKGTVHRMLWLVWHLPALLFTWWDIPWMFFQMEPRVPLHLSIPVPDQRQSSVSLSRKRFLQTSETKCEKGSSSSLTQTAAWQSTGAD